MRETLRVRLAQLFGLDAEQLQRLGTQFCSEVDGFVRVTFSSLPFGEDAFLVGFGGGQSLALTYVYIYILPACSNQASGKWPVDETRVPFGTMFRLRVCWMEGMCVCVQPIYGVRHW